MSKAQTDFRRSFRQKTGRRTIRQKREEPGKGSGSPARTGAGRLKEQGMEQVQVHSAGRLAIVASLLVVAGCNQTQTGGAIAAGGSASTPTPAVIQAVCPQVYLRDGTAMYRTYSKGGAKDDPNAIVYQASLADTTRQCIQSETELKVTVVARAVSFRARPAGQAPITMPIRVAATDGDKVLVSELTQFPAEVQPGAGATQFIFSKVITIPAGAGNFTKIYLGFDEGRARSRRRSSRNRSGKTYAPTALHLATIVILGLVPGICGGCRACAVEDWGRGVDPRVKPEDDARWGRFLRGLQHKRGGIDSPSRTVMLRLSNAKPFGETIGSFLRIDGDLHTRV